VTELLELFRFGVAPLQLVVRGTSPTRRKTPWPATMKP
jgi:hypothetical protein